MKKLMLYKWFVIFLAVFGLVGLSHMWSGDHYAIDKASPSGVYRVQIEFREEKGTGTRDRNERLKITCLKRDEIIYAGEWVNSDQYESSLRNGIQNVEWIADNVLRIAKDLSARPFDDDIIVRNDTDESLKYLEVDYGRDQSFHAFDLAPRTQITLLASPEFKQDGSSNYFLGYGGKTQRGKEFHGTLEHKRRESAAEGALKFQITLTARDLR